MDAQESHPKPDFQEFRESAHTASYINVIELSYSIWDSIPVTYDPITRFLLGAFPVTKTGFLALAGSTQISRMGSSPNLQRGCEPPEIR